MIRKSILTVMLLCGVAVSSVMAQKKNFSYKFYGQIRTDLYYNSRANVETVDGLFYMFPKDNIVKDANGKDLNDYAAGDFYAIYSRLGLDVKGPTIGKKVKTSAKFEVDLRGSGTNFSMFRVRHAYMNFDWGTSALLLGQTWHPLYGNVTPDILNLNMGAPYQPFGRAPQIRYQYSDAHFLVTASAIWQSQYLSVGPKSNRTGEIETRKSQDFIKNSCIPEFYAGVDYKNDGLFVGAGVHVSSITPRVKSEFDGEVYKVHERVTGVSGEAHIKYKAPKLFVAAKTLLSTNLTQTSNVGGYGVTSVDSETGEQEYAPLRTSHTWANLVYGSKWKVGLFAGYLKNLGANKKVDNIISSVAIADKKNVTSIDDMSTVSAELTYNLPHWKFGAEYSWCGANYGNYTEKGRVTNTHLVKNNRFVFVAMFMF